VLLSNQMSFKVHIANQINKANSMHEFKKYEKFVKFDLSFNGIQISNDYAFKYAQCYCGGKYRHTKAQKFAKVAVNACVLVKWVLCDVAIKNLLCMHAHNDSMSIGLIKLLQICHNQ